MNAHVRCSASAALALVWVFARLALAAPQSLSFSPGDGLTQIQDTYIQFSSPDVSNGAALDFGADRDDPPGTAVAVQGLLRIDGVFGLSPRQIPPDAVIESAVLEIDVFNGAIRLLCIGC